MRVAVLGAGITGVTTTYSLLERDLEVTVFDRNRYAAMETSFANAQGGNGCSDAGSLRLPGVSQC